jgi:ribulose-5-phosphate 4-epimerase/fuculose-1-phosphate aldolase
MHHLPESPPVLLEHPPAEELEGVVKYCLEFTPAPAPDWALLAGLDAWRTLLFWLGLTGHDPQRYGGLAYGNVSVRQEGRRFLVSGTQTGAIPQLTAEHYCRVLDFDTARNRIVAEGVIHPSSEALTHAAVYRASAAIRCVLHVHTPELWRQAARLGLPVTHPAIAYGTPAMALEVEALLRDAGVRVIAMGGHLDGIIAVGASVEDAALPLLSALAEAVRLERAQLEAR